MRVTILIVLVLILTRCGSSPAEEIPVSQGETTKELLTGLRARWIGYAIDTTEFGRVWAQKVTNMGVSTEFAPDGSLIIRQGTQIDRQQWRTEGDSVFWAGNAFRVYKMGGSVFLENEAVKVELMPE